MNILPNKDQYEMSKSLNKLYTLPHFTWEFYIFNI